MISIPTRVALNTGDLLMCGTPLALMADDFGANRPPIDRTNRFMTCSSVNSLSMYGFAWLDEQCYLVQKCKLVDHALTKTCNKAPRAFKCVSVKFAGVAKNRLLWLDQAISTVRSDRPRIQFVSDILNSSHFQPISTDNPELAEEQVKALIQDIEQKMDGDDAVDVSQEQEQEQEQEQNDEERDGQGQESEHEDQHKRRHRASADNASEADDEEQLQGSQATIHYMSQQPEDQDELDDEHDGQSQDTETNKPKSGQSERDPDNSDEDDGDEQYFRKQNHVEHDYNVDVDPRDEMVPFSQMRAALAGKDNKISELQV